MKLRIATIAVACISMLAWLPATAQDGAPLFKTKCAMCHGDQRGGSAKQNSRIGGKFSSQPV